jgi:hypothetical protein
MTIEGQTLVRDSFARVVLIAPGGGTVLRPAVRSRPLPETAVQGRHERIGPQADGDDRHRRRHLDRLETIVPAVQDLGRRHPPVEAAWTEAYTPLATTMKDAAAA